MSRTFDLTPDPKVLIALTRTPMAPMDALCELVDNAIDSFASARLKGVRIENPMIHISLPSPSDVRNGLGEIAIRDNGPGMTDEEAEFALKAGFSGNNPFDNLGLFGMGFNISTGKFGAKTSLLTATATSSEATSVIVDLAEMQRQRSYDVPVEEVAKPTGFRNGTIVKIKDWWPAGDANADFCKKLVQYGLPTVRRELGRRYATILRRTEESAISVFVNGEQCSAFDHCVWSDSRFVTHRSLGQISAITRLDQSIGAQVRCTACTALVPEGASQCPACKNVGFRTINETIRGWIGIQRFDDESDFGIDLIRNGRTIRIGEKSAFFEFTDEFKRVTKDYPNDQQYGRIVGEIHIDHVPVDFLKQDFQRSTPEWQRAIEFIRGNSSLQPKQPGANENASPLFRLYQGYRRVRDFGKGDLYMGYFDPVEGKAKRISRDIEKDYYKKFQERLPGYYDDSEWWKLVEAADEKPVEPMVDCPDCHVENDQHAEICVACGCILKGKACLNSACAKKLPASAQSCPYCGTNQIIEIKTQWKCLVCGGTNHPDLDHCVSCDSKRGTPDAISLEYLRANSNKMDDISIPGCSIKLSGGTNSSPMDVNVWVSRQPIKTWNSPSQLPSLTFRTSAEIDIFIDLQHPEFVKYGVIPEIITAYEMAAMIHAENSSLLASHKNTHTLHNIAWLLMEKYYSSRLAESLERMRTDVKALLTSIRERLSDAFKGYTDDAYAVMDEPQVGSMVKNMQHAELDISKLGELKSTGTFLLYVDESTILNLFKQFPLRFFDGTIWTARLSGLTELPEAIAAEVRERTIAETRNCLEDICSFIQESSPSISRLRRCRLSLDILFKTLA